jgi:hypothetical protein
LRGKLEYLVISNSGQTEKIELPFSEEAVRKLSPSFTEKTKFLVRGGRHDFLYGLPKKEWEELSHEDAIDYGIYGRRRAKNERSKI